MAIKEHYNNYQPRDYNQPYDLLTPSTVIPEYLVDHNRLELNPDDTLPAWQARPDLKRVVSLTFRYQPHNTSNANARDTLRYGTVETLFAQQAVLQARIEWVEARSQVLQTQVGLYKALGGGW